MIVKDLIDVLEVCAPVIIKDNFSCETLYDGLTTDLYELIHFSDILFKKVKRISARDTTLIIIV